jgi:hypothetical protein
MKLIGTLEAHSSKSDKYGNRYWGLRYTDHKTGKTVNGTVSGGESNIAAIRMYWTKPGQWDDSVRLIHFEHGIRDFKVLTSAWKHAGSQPEELANYIKNELGENDDK